MRTRKKLKMIDRERADWRRWCHDAERRQRAAVDAAEAAWGIIANAYGGDWAQATDEWREAAERWRDAMYHPLLADHALAVTPEATDGPTMTLRYGEPTSWEEAERVVAREFPEEAPND